MNMVVNLVSSSIRLWKIDLLIPSLLTRNIATNITPSNNRTFVTLARPPRTGSSLTADVHQNVHMLPLMLEIGLAEIDQEQMIVILFHQILLLLKTGGCSWWVLVHPLHPMAFFQYSNSLKWDISTVILSILNMKFGKILEKYFPELETRNMTANRYDSSIKKPLNSSLKTLFEWFENSLSMRLSGLNIVGSKKVSKLILGQDFRLSKLSSQ